MPVPSLLSKSVDEFIAEQQFVNKRHLKQRGNLSELLEPPVPKPGGRVQVWFYKDLNQLLFRHQPDLIDDFTIGRRDFDVKQIKERWALENCHAVHPDRWEPYPLGEDDKMSLVTLRNFTSWTDPQDWEDQPINCLIFIEGSISEKTAKIRRLRMLWWNAKHYTIYTPIFLIELVAKLLLIPTLSNIISGYTQRALNHAQAKLKLLEGQVDKKLVKTLPNAQPYNRPRYWGGLVPMLYTLFFYLFLLCFVSMWVMGYGHMHVHPVQRALSWMDQGTFLLDVCPNERS